MIQAKDFVRDLASYQLADLSSPSGKPAVSLAQNESPFPPSPKVLAAITEAAQDLQLYSDPDWPGLRAAIAEVHGLDPQTILCGAGSMELIKELIRCYAGPGDVVLSSQYGYGFFRAAALAAGAAYEAAPEENFTVSVDALLAAVTSQTRVLCLANPGNPTGTRLPRAEIQRLHDGLPDDILLVVDEAYQEFVEHPEGPTFDLVSGGRTVILRTFSKAYCLAGLRVGWGVFPEAVAGELRKVLTPNNISSVAETGARAAMLDQAYCRTTVGETIALRESFAQSLSALGFEAPQSHTNFVLIPFKSVEPARQADHALRSEGLILRGMAGYGLAHCLRATIGGKEDMDGVLAVLSQWQKEKSL